MKKYEYHFARYLVTSPFPYDGYGIHAGTILHLQGPDMRPSIKTGDRWGVFVGTTYNDKAWAPPYIKNPENHPNNLRKLNWWECLPADAYPACVAIATDYGDLKARDVYRTTRSQQEGRALLATGDATLEDGGNGFTQYVPWGHLMPADHEDYARSLSARIDRNYPPLAAKENKPTYGEGSYAMADTAAPGTKDKTALVVALPFFGSIAWTAELADMFNKTDPSKYATGCAPISDNYRPANAFEAGIDNSIVEALKQHARANTPIDQLFGPKNSRKPLKGKPHQQGKADALRAILTRRFINKEPEAVEEAITLITALYDNQPTSVARGKSYLNYTRINNYNTSTAKGVKPWHETLLILAEGAVADGDLISKEQRDTLVGKHYVDRAAGFNFITREGLIYLSDMGFICP